jgi:hypothetical protein
MEWRGESETLSPEREVGIRMEMDWYTETEKGGRGDK